MEEVVAGEALVATAVATREEVAVMEAATAEAGTRGDVVHTALIVENKGERPRLLGDEIAYTYCCSHTYG